MQRVDSSAAEKSNFTHDFQRSRAACLADVTEPTNDIFKDLIGNSGSHLRTAKDGATKGTGMTLIRSHPTKPLLRPA